MEKKVPSYEDILVDEGTDVLSIPMVKESIHDVFFCPWCRARLDLREDPDYTKIHFFNHMIDDLNESFEENGDKMRIKHGYLMSIAPDPALRRLLQSRISGKRNEITYEKIRENKPPFRQEYGIPFEEDDGT